MPIKLKPINAIGFRAIARANLHLTKALPLFNSCFVYDSLFAGILII